VVSVEEEIVKTLSQNTGAVLATVVSRAGSAPRGVGAKMVLREDGSSIGTIGGGSLEAQVLREARHVMEAGQARTLRLQLTARQLAEDGSICGGNVTIFLEPLRAGTADLLEIYRTIVSIRKTGGNSLLASIVSVNDTHSRGIKAKALIDRKGQAIGNLIDDPGLIKTLWSQREPLLRENQARMVTIERNDQEVQVLLEPIRSEPTVFIFGCGHVSTCLAPLAKAVGFKVVVADDRPEFANRERFPDADEIIVDRYEGLLKKLEIDETAYLIIVTRGHLHDSIVLEQAVQKNARYIGMIGSQRKIRMLYDTLTERGISQDLLKRVHAPIGLDIGAETPEEIAVSIVAQLIQARAEKT
jgi:xanthine dehydrogenase accessory factor